MTRKLAKTLNAAVGQKSVVKKMTRLVKPRSVKQHQANDRSPDESASILKIKSQKSPRDYQKLAIEKVVNGFEKADRGQLIMPCGTGKTLISLWVHEQLSPAYTLVLFPSLALLRQSKDEWAKNRKHPIPYMCVCSEKDIDKGADTPRISLSEIGGNVSTDPEAIRTFLEHHGQAIIFSTYQSLGAVSQALKETNLSFDLAICDEAHKTAGTQKGAYSLIHDNSMIPVSKRLYMTATPRVISQRLKGRLTKEELPYIADMGDPETFGPELHRMSFKEAIDLGVLVDYKIVAIGVTDAEIQRIIKEGRFAKKGAKIEEIANNYALERFMGHYEASSVITFHSSIKKAGDFKERHQELFKGVKAFHVNGTQSTKERQSILNEFAGLSQSIVTNARCLTEGVDIPVVDAVFFCDPKNSKIDIVQAAGRALRRADDRNKTMGYIVVPLFHRHEDDLESVIETGAFANLLNVIRGLSNHDERITDVVRQFKHDQEGLENPNNSGRRGEDLTLIELSGVAESLGNRLFDEVIDNFRLPWRSFEEARAFAHGLNIKSKEEWEKYSKSGDKPSDIPMNPSGFYKGKGWVSWGDWLGTGNVASYNKQFREFKDARAFVQGLQLNDQHMWHKYSKSGNKPSDIPADPSKTYKGQGWISWGDWLGTGFISTRHRKYRSFEEARLFVHKLGVQSGPQWQHYCLSGNKPDDIPTDPSRTYKGQGWVSWGNWLGTAAIASRYRKYKSFEEARLFVHKLGLKSWAQWQHYCLSGNKPDDIPTDPSRTYKGQGWVSWGDWLGTGFICLRNRKYRSFEEAKSIVQGLSLKTWAEWRAYCKSGNKPSDIPSVPSQTYKDKGWLSMKDWLGTTKIDTRNKNSSLKSTRNNPSKPRSQSQEQSEGLAWLD